jgi:hypothetical protein
MNIFFQIKPPPTLSEFFVLFSDAALMAWIASGEYFLMPSIKAISEKLGL